MRVTDRRLAPRNVAAIVKQGAARLGFDPSTFGGHSLRAGFVTSAVKRGANLIKIPDVTGHKSLEDAQDLRPRRRSLERPSARVTACNSRARASGCRFGSICYTGSCSR